MPVWVFTAQGTNASGSAVSAVFTVDAVVPEFRARGTGGVGSVSADLLLGYQLDTLAGQRRELLSPGTALSHYGLGACSPDMTMPDADTATGTIQCDGPKITFTVKRAFPGLASSIWFVSESRK